jgi:hypothetical protein
VHDGARALEAVAAARRKNGVVDAVSVKKSGRLNEVLVKLAAKNPNKIIFFIFINPSK